MAPAKWPGIQLETWSRASGPCRGKVHYTARSFSGIGKIKHIEQFDLCRFRVSNGLDNDRAASRLETLQLRTRQPEGSTERRAKSPKLVKNLRQYVPRLLHQRFITNEAAGYLLGFANGTLVRLARPASYPFLNYRWEHNDAAMPIGGQVMVQYEDAAPAKRLRVVRLRDIPLAARVAVADGESDDGDDGDPGPLDICLRER
jgi:hypothetical protein